VRKSLVRKEKKHSYGALYGRGRPSLSGDHGAMVMLLKRPRGSKKKEERVAKGGGESDSPEGQEKAVSQRPNFNANIGVQCQSY